MCTLKSNLKNVSIKMLIIEKTVYFKIIIQSVCVHLEVYYNALGPRFATRERAGGGGGSKALSSGRVDV